MLFDGDEDVVAAFEILADALVEVVEGILGVREAAGGEVLAYEDGAVGAVEDSVAGADLRAVDFLSACAFLAWHIDYFVWCAVEAYAVCLACGAWGAKGFVENDAWHLAGAELALLDFDLIGASQEAVNSVFCAVADLGAIDEDFSVDTLFVDSYSLDYNLHNAEIINLKIDIKGEGLGNSLHPTP